MVQVLGQNHLSLDQQQPASQPILCLNRLIEDLEYLYQNSQTADVIFLLENTTTTTAANNNNNTNTTSQHSSKNDGNELACNGTNKNNVTKTEEIALYAHRLILQARCQNFRQVQSPDHLCCRTLYGSIITRDNNIWYIRWPQIKPNILKQVLHYIYTSKIDINDGHHSTIVDNNVEHLNDKFHNEENLFEILAIAYELGLEELIAIGEERAAITINIHNACRYLNEAIKIKSKINGNDCNRIVQLCMQFISQWSKDCVKTNSFLNISKETMIHLLSSDQFALEEADVFRSTLEWAKYQTGIDKRTEHWTEEDRQQIQNQLSGVINHLRILLIDSHVFAEEVEPTGVIPIELSLERYRFAALTIKKPLNDPLSGNKRLQPRVYINRYFPESKLLFNNTIKYEHILNEWFDPAVHHQWKLIFRASEHEFSAEAFHNYCDGIKPTFILILSTKGYLSGGFSDVAWKRGNKGRGCYEQSERSFLFRLQSPCNQKMPVKFDIQKKIFAIGHMASKGPVFGAGADLLLADSCHLNEDSYTNMPHSYNGPEASVDTLFGSYYFTVIDYEVFTINSN